MSGCLLRVNWAWLGLFGILSALAEVPEPKDFWTADPKAEVPSTLSGGRVLDLAALRRDLAGGAFIVDVSRTQHRPEALPEEALWMPTPHPGIPGSHWWPGVGEGRLRADEESAFRLRIESLTHADKSATLIFYCHERCWLSWNAAKRAVGYGYTHIEWYPDGIEGWTRANLPTVTLNPEAAAGSP